MTDAPRRSRVDVLDLTLAQVDQVERAVGKPFQDWQSVSRIALARAVLTASGVISDEQASGMTVRELQDAILVETDTEAPADP